MQRSFLQIWHRDRKLHWPIFGLSVTDDDDGDDDDDDDLMMIRKRRILMMLMMKGPQCSGDTGVWFWEWMPASWIDLMLPRVLQTS